MSELYPPDIELNDLSGTTDAEQEVLYVPIGQTPYYTSFYKMLYRLCDVARRAGDLRVYKDGDLTFGVRAGMVQNGTNSIGIAASAGNALIDNATNYIYYAIGGSNASLAIGTAGYPQAEEVPHVPLASIVCAGGTYSFDDISDARGLAFVRPGTAMSVEHANTLVGGPESNADDLHTHSGVSSAVEDMITLETNADKVLKPDGEGGVEWGYPGAGTNGAPTDASYWLGGTNTGLPNAIVPAGTDGVTVNAACGTVGLNFHSITESTSMADADELVIFDDSEAGYRKISATNAKSYLGTTATAGASETIVRKLTQLALTGTTQVAYTCPTSYCAQIAINLANIDATSQCAATGYIVDVSTTQTATLPNGLLINKNNSHAIGQKINLEAGDKILLSAGGASQIDAILSIREKLLTTAVEEWKMQATATLGTAAAAAYTCPAGKYAQFVMMAGNVLATTAATSVTIKVADLSTTQTLTIANALAIAKNQYMPYSFDSIGNEGFVLEAGDSVQANANAASAVSFIVNASEWSTT